MKTYADVKRRAKLTELKAGEDVLPKHTGTKDKFTSYWTNDLFTVTKVNGPTIIVRRKRDGKAFARNISLVKKYKHISDSDDHSDVDSSNLAGMNTENPHPDGRDSNTDSVENLDRTFVVHPVHEIPRFDLVKRTHIEKNLVGRICDICSGLCMGFVHVNFVYGLFM